MHNVAIATRNDSPLDRLSSNEEIRRVMTSLVEARKGIKDLDMAIRQACGERPGWMRQGVRRALCAVVPRVWRKKFIFLACEEDALSLIESLMRKNLNGVQEAATWIAETSEEMEQWLAELERLVEMAASESWDAKRILTTIGERAGVKFMKRVEEMLGVQLELLTEAQREAERRRLLDALLAEIALGQDLRILLQKVGGASLTVFSAAVTQFHAFVSVARPVAVLRDAASRMVDMNTASIVARTALEETVRQAVGAIEASIEATRVAEAYAVSGVEMRALLNEGSHRIDDKLAGLLPANTETVVD